MRRSSPFLRMLRLSCIAWALCSGGPARAQDGVLHERQKLIGVDTTPVALFGRAVSISGGWAIVGAPQSGPRIGNVLQGAAFMFRLDDNGTPSIPSDDLWVQQQKLPVSGQAAYDYFGTAVAIDGSWAVVGVPGDDDSGSKSGSAYIFRLDNNGTPSDGSDDTWVEEAKLLAGDGAEGDGFGGSVAIDGARVIVGAPNDDDRGWYAGAAYVFLHDDRGTPLDPSDDLWVQEAKLVAPDGKDLDQFGWSIAISNNRILVGAPHPYGDSLYASPGAAYVFRPDDGGTPSDPSDDRWVFEDKLTPLDSALYDGFGYAVAIRGEIVVVGAVDGHNNVCRNGGGTCVTSDDCAVGVCDTNGSACHADAECTQAANACALPSDMGPCDGICPRYFYNGCTGQCELFQYGCCGGNANNFLTLAECQASCPPAEPHVCLLPPDPGTGTSDVPRFFYDPCTSRCESFTYHGSGGNANNFVLLADCEAACPPPSPPPPRCVGGDVCGVLTGCAYVFRFDSAAWLQESKLTPPDGKTYDAFGGAVSLDVDEVIVGAEWNDGGCPGTDPDCATGAAYAFRRLQTGSPTGIAGAMWVQQAKLTPSDPARYHGFGVSVATHGPWVIVGASGSGAAYLFVPPNSSSVDRAIPAVSEWGMVVLMLLLLTAGTLALPRRRGPAV